MQTRYRYEFQGGFCLHDHGVSDPTNPFNTGWENVTLRFRARDWHGADLGPFVKAVCADLGIAWLEQAPRPRASAALLAILGGVQDPPVSDAEDAASRTKYAALALGDIFDFGRCSTPGCANNDPLGDLFAEWINVVIHAPVGDCDTLLSSLYDWNHNN